MTDRVAYVTSGARGLGYAVVRALLEAGWDVFFTYHTSADTAAQLLEHAASLGRTARSIQADLLDPRQVAAAAEACLADMGKVDAFIHNFGPFVFERQSLADYSDDLWRKMIDGNLSNFFWTYRRLVGGMRRQGFGRIVTVGYDGAGSAEGWRYRAPYAAAKSALASLTRSIAKEERQNGITANMVCPGDIRGTHKMQFIDEVYRAGDRLGRPPVGEDVARVVVFLCHEHSQQLNGTITEVTGGYEIRADGAGKDVVVEPVQFKEGDTVWVHPWNRPGQVRRVVTAPNRNIVYEVADDEWVGSFTVHQLDRWSHG